MRRIAIINQKGGVGKTTTTVNVGCALARAGHRVLLIDLDPQAHLSLYLGQDPAAGQAGVYEMLTGSASVAKVRRKIGSNLSICGANIDLAGAEVELVSVVGREVLLRDLLDQHVSASKTPPYDYVLMDCPPSLNVLTLNALSAATEVLIPLQPHYLALQGLSKLLETVALVSKRINPTLKVTGVVVCMNETGTKLASEVIDDVRAFFDGARGKDVPWNGTRVFQTVIRRNIKLAESPSYGKSIFDYAPESHGAHDYQKLAAELHSPDTFRPAEASEEPAGAVPLVAAPDEEAVPAVQTPSAAVTRAPEKPQSRVEPAKPTSQPAAQSPHPGPIGTSRALPPSPAGDVPTSTRPVVDPALTEPVRPKPLDQVRRKRRISATANRRPAAVKGVAPPGNHEAGVPAEPTRQGPTLAANPEPAVAPGGPAPETPGVRTEGDHRKVRRTAKPAKAPGPPPAIVRADQPMAPSIENALRAPALSEPA
jgi:chromosome partitioning protein